MHWEARSQQAETNASWNDSFAVSFVHLELRRECKKDYVRAAESKAEIGLRGSYDYGKVRKGDLVLEGSLRRSISKAC